MELICFIFLMIGLIIGFTIDRIIVILSKKIRGTIIIDDGEDYHLYLELDNDEYHHIITHQIVTLSTIHVNSRK